MIHFVHKGKKFTCRKKETILEALLRQGQNPLFSCRNGVCLVCLQRCVGGTPTEESQRGLRPSLKQMGYFLPCKCVPISDMELASMRPADLFGPAVVTGKELLAEDICRLTLEPATSLYYHAGQFINLRREDGLTRSYSLASLPAEDQGLELHVKRLPSGEMSNWIFDRLSIGDEIEFQGPLGMCHYTPEANEKNLLLVGNGTGAAPLIGIVRDALHIGHKGQIWMFHGSRRREGLYLHETLAGLAEQHANFQYVPCISGDDAPSGFTHGRVHKMATARCTNLSGWRVYVAGLPEMVAELRTMAVHAGASPSEVFADPYEIRHMGNPPAAAGSTAEPEPPANAETTGSDVRGIARGEPDSELWSVLQEGKLLNEILTDFYTQVFEDPVLSPYFRGVTKERLIGQVFSFMRDSFAGRKEYFGMRPRMAHHWMVISNEVFDRREHLMEATIRRHGLPEPMIQRWLEFEKRFREDIVKSVPWKLVVNGVEMPLEGFGEQVISAGTLCDSCQREIDAGERVRYHLRLGLTYCGDCAFSATGESVTQEEATS